MKPPSVLLFQELNVLLRGAATKGKLIHEMYGPIFGPAMNEAYILESKHAFYPRIIISTELNENLEAIQKDHPLLKPIQKSHDGFLAIDLASIVEHVPFEPPIDIDSMVAKLCKIENEIPEKSPDIAKKFSYLKNRFTEIKKIEPQEP